MCECGRGPVESGRGRSRDRALAGCRHCNALDGVTPRQREAIHLLRVSNGPMSTDQMAEGLGIRKDNAMHLMRRLEQAGFVTRRRYEGGHVEGVANCFGHGSRRVNRTAIQAWWSLAPVREVA